MDYCAASVDVDEPRPPEPATSPGDEAKASRLKKSNTAVSSPQGPHSARNPAAPGGEPSEVAVAPADGAIWTQVGAKRTKKRAEPRRERNSPPPPGLNRIPPDGTRTYALVKEAKYSVKLDCVRKEASEGGKTTKTPTYAEVARTLSGGNARLACFRLFVAN